MASASSRSARASAVLSSASSEPGSAKRSSRSKSTPPAGKSSPSTGRKPSATTTSTPGTVKSRAKAQSSLLRDSRASPTRKQGSASRKKTRETSGRLSHGPFAWHDPKSSSWRTWNASFSSGFGAFLGTWPRSGMMLNGIAYRRRASVPLTSVIGSSSWPTLTVADSYTASLQSSQQKKNSRHSLSLSVAVNRCPGPLLPTATLKDATGRRFASDGQPHLPGAIGGLPNPPWLEWFMGFPPTWTEPESSSSGTPSSLKLPSTLAESCELAWGCSLE